MRKFITGALLRLGITYSATNYIAVDSLLERKAGLYQMLVNAKWRESRYVRATTKGSHVEGLVASQEFYMWAKRVVRAIKPLYA